jgi:hypothetical protein
MLTIPLSRMQAGFFLDAQEFKTKVGGHLKFSLKIHFVAKNVNTLFVFSISTVETSN